MKTGFITKKNVILTIVQDKHVKRGSQPRIKEGASHHARCGKNAEAFLIVPCQLSYEKLRRY